MKKLYHIYDSNGVVTHAALYNENEKPVNAISVDNYKFVKGMVNLETLEIYEGATDEEIAEIESKSVPQELTRSQLRQALLIKGIDEEDIVTAINAITNELHRKIMLIKWQDQQTYRRNNEDLKSIGQALGLTDKEINDIFILGATL